MAGGWDRGYRQKIVDEYLNATGKNHFIPVEFLAWLKPQTEHRVWDVFYGKSDEDAAMEFRIAIARQFVSGLRISVVVSEETVDSKQVTVRLPAFISPVSDRANGGGYISVDTNDGTTMRELARQASSDLARWVERYEGTAKLLGIDVTSVNEIAGAFAARGVEDAA